MKKIIILLLFGAMAFTATAQQDTVGINVDDLSFHCQIEGQKITFPCQWSELERMGWSFHNPEDSAEVILPTYNLTLLDVIEVPVLSPQKRKAEIYFCNVSDKYKTRKQSMVYGIVYIPDTSSITVYDFKLSRGLAGGMSDNGLEATYGDPERTEQYDLYQFWRHAKSDDGCVVVVANERTGAVAEGTVIGFATLARSAVGRLIEQAGIAVSDEQANDMGTKRMYEREIIGWTKELQLAETDPVKNNPIYISQIKHSLAMSNYFLGNFKESFEWELQSAEGGHKEAQHCIGVMYSRGEGVEQDHQSAASWYEKAALQGHPIAMNNLGNCYDEGTGVEQSEAKAFGWWIKAAQNGFTPLYPLLPDYYGDGICRAKKDYKEAVHWYEEAANSGNPTGIYNLSYMYYNGYRVKRDYRKAFEILCDADMSKHYVQQSLGEHYYYGRGVEKDIPKAITHFSNFLDLIESEDADTRESYTKEIKKARKIIDKNPCNRGVHG